MNPTQKQEYNDLYAKDKVDHQYQIWQNFLECWILVFFFLKLIQQIEKIGKFLHRTYVVTFFL